jgi:HEAT repeat protein
MEKVLAELIALAVEGNVEQRCASLIVLGALKLQNTEVAKTVSAMMDEPNPVLKDYALRYFEQVQGKQSVVIFAKHLDDSDKEIQDRAIRALTKAGDLTVEPIMKRLAAASRTWQINAVRVLCTLQGKIPWTSVLQLLLSGNDEFNKSICDLLTPKIRQMNEKEQAVFDDAVKGFAKTLDDKQQRPAVISAMRLLGLLGRPDARRWLFKFVGPEHHQSVRAHALVALLRCLREQDLSKDDYAELLPILEEAEFSEVTRLTLELLDQHQLPEQSRALLSRLLESPHPDVQKFALRKMADFSTPATVRTLIEQLGDADYRRRDIAAGSLRKLPEARPALVKELLVCAEPSKAWSIAELLTSIPGKWRQETFDALWKRLQGAISAEDRIQTAFLHVLKKAAPDHLYEQLAAQGARLIKAKKYKEGLAYLLPLKDFAEFRPEDKFQLGLAQLKLHAHTVASHRHHPAVELFSELYRSSAFPLFEALKKEKTLAPEEHFALGFTLVERSGDERHLGRDLLEHVASKSPRTKIGKGAKNKVKLLNW